MSFFDTHVHYSGTKETFGDFLQPALDAGVGSILLCSSGWENSLLSARCAEMFSNVFFAAGIHPHEALSETAHPARDYAEFRSFPRLSAIGEIGLDYYYDLTPREVQKTLFADFLKLALELDLPAIVHCRDKDGDEQAYADALELLTPFAESGGRFELHAYAGSLEYLKKFLDLGSFFGVGGMVTFKRAENIRILADAMPVERILLETDTPYLAPVPFRGKENHPMYLPYTAGVLAERKGMSAAEIGDRTTANARIFFRTEKGGEK